MKSCKIKQKRKIHIHTQTEIDERRNHWRIVFKKLTIFNWMKSEELRRKPRLSQYIEAENQDAINQTSRILYHTP